MNEFNRFTSILCMVFSVFNMLDLHYTLQYIEYEINPLVLYNFPLFYMTKFIVSTILMTIGIFMITRGNKK